MMRESFLWTQPLPRIVKLAIEDVLVTLCPVPEGEKYTWTGTSLRVLDALRLAHTEYELSYAGYESALSLLDRLSVHSWEGESADFILDVSRADLHRGKQASMADREALRRLLEAEWPSFVHFLEARRTVGEKG